MKNLIVIPARLQSTRLPQKPLKDIAGKTLIQRVYEQAIKVRSATRVVIATDNTEIEAHAKKFGAEVIMTSPEIRTGSDRVAAVFEKLGQPFDLVANVQGDMPFINPEVVERTFSFLEKNRPQFEMATIVTPITDKEEYLRPSCVKAALGENNRVLYFSRAPIPWIRDQEGFVPTEKNPWAYRHLGLYVFTPAALQKFPTLSAVEVEDREKLEQLRALAHGVKIGVEVIEAELLRHQIEVDTPEDLAKAIEISRSFER